MRSFTVIPMTVSLNEWCVCSMCVWVLTKYLNVLSTFYINVWFDVVGMVNINSIFCIDSMPVVEQVKEFKIVYTHECVTAVL